MPSQALCEVIIMCLRVDGVMGDRGTAWVGAWGRGGKVCCPVVVFPMKVCVSAILTISSANNRMIRISRMASMGAKRLLRFPTILQGRHCISCTALGKIAQRFATTVADAKETADTTKSQTLKVDDAPQTPPVNALSHAAANCCRAAEIVAGLRHLHMNGHARPDRLELQAWRELQYLKDEDVEFADGKSVSQLLNSWAYFSRFWAKGKDGPEKPLPVEATSPDDIPVPVSPDSLVDSSAPVQHDAEDVLTPAADLAEAEGMHDDEDNPDHGDPSVPPPSAPTAPAESAPKPRRLERRNVQSAPTEQPPRSNPLDEIIDE